jgi:sugar O-acyltransferase (sialic acid O-acetyltransferase NeuD family)
MRIIIYGAGGHGKVVYDALIAEGKNEVIGFIDDLKKKGEKIFDKKILGGKKDLEYLIKNRKIDGIIAAFADIKKGNQLREEIYNYSEKMGLKIAGVIHPRSIISRYAEINSTAQIFAGAIISAGSKIGKGTIINHNSVVDHDCSVGNYVHIAPNATLCGSVSAKNYSYIGAGSVIKEKIKIGKNSIVGMGAAVIENVSDNFIVMGIPAKPRN